MMVHQPSALDDEFLALFLCEVERRRQAVATIHDDVMGVGGSCPDLELCRHGVGDPTGTDAQDCQRGRLYFGNHDGHAITL